MAIVQSQQGDHLGSEQLLPRGELGGLGGAIHRGVPLEPLGVQQALELADPGVTVAGHLPDPVVRRREHRGTVGQLQPQLANLASVPWSSPPAVSPPATG